MKAHPALPDIRDLEGMGEIKARLVEQTVAHSPTDDDTEHPVKEEILDVLKAPGGGGVRGARIRLVLQARACQEHEQRKGDQISDTVPVHGQGA